MAYNIQFETGEEVEFENEPTMDQVNDAAKMLGIKSVAPEIPEAVLQTTKEKLKPLANGVKGVFTGAAKGALELVKRTGQLGESVGQTILGGVEKATGLKVTPESLYGSEEALAKSKLAFLGEEKLEAKGTAEKIGKGVVKVGEFLIPAAKLATASKGLGLTKTVLSRALTSGTVATVQEGKLGKGTAIAAGLEAVLPAASYLTKGGRALSSMFIRPNAKQAKLIQAFEAGISKINPITPADTAVRFGIWGTDKGMGIAATKEANRLFKKTIEPAVKGIKEQLKTSEILGDVEKYVTKEASLSRRKDLVKAFSELKDDYSKVVEQKYETWQKVKQSIDEGTPIKGFADDRIASAYKDIQHEMADVIRQKTYSKLKDIDIKSNYLDYGNLLKLQTEGAQAMTRGTTITFGTLASTAIDKTIQPITTGVGTFSYKIGNFILNVPKKLTPNIKTIKDYARANKTTVEALMRSGIIQLSQDQ